MPDQPAPDGVSEAVTVDQEPQRGIFVIKSVGQDGSISTDIEIHGVEATEVSTLLELGLIRWRQQIGLPRMVG